MAGLCLTIVWEKLVNAESHRKYFDNQIQELEKEIKDIETCSNLPCKDRVATCRYIIDVYSKVTFVDKPKGFVQIVRGESDEI